MAYGSGSGGAQPGGDTGAEASEVTLQPNGIPLVTLGKGAPPARTTWLP
ncbi:hypothetical protein [Streptomyces sp. NPDC046332]